ncbi:MAG: hypothetical protein Q8K52_09235 [Thiobacillus sp.]|nr:hypothetical protein [Thiobacillus sp.]
MDDLSKLLDAMESPARQSDSYIKTLRWFQWQSECNVTAET